MKKMSQQSQSPGLSGRTTRARAKMLENSSMFNTSVLHSSKSKTGRNISQSRKKNSGKNKSNSTKSVSTSDSEDTCNVSLNKNKNKRSMRSSTREVKPADTSQKTETNSSGSGTDGKLSPLIKFEGPKNLDTTFTPESSPVVAKLSPRRSIKTPKKSPKELASPKSHTITSAKVSKTPRKLVLLKNSPPTSYTETDTESPTSLHDINASTAGSIKSVNSFNTDGSTMTQPNIGVGIRRYSKSPKIVLRTPKPKSRKSKSPKLSHSKRFSTPLHSNKLTTTPVAKHKISMPETNPKKTTVTKLNMASPATPSPVIKESLLRDVMTRKVPIVVLQRLSVLGNATETTPVKTAQETPTSSISTLHRDSPSKIANSLRTGSSPRLSKSPRTSVLNKLRASAASDNKYQTPPESKRKRSEPLSSSTPYDRKKPHNETDTSFGSVSKLIAKGSPRFDTKSPLLSVSEIAKSIIANESEPPLYNSATAHPEVNEEQEGIQEEMNGTYELLEPKTPNLREKSIKRSSADANLQNSHKEKKTRKVRFASPTKNKNADGTKKNVIRRIEAGRIEKVRIPIQKVNPVKKVLFSSGSSSKSKVKSLINFGSQSGSVMNGSLLASKKTTNNRRSNSYCEPSKTVSSSERVSPKNPSVNDSSTKSSAKKIPNFAKIHDKLFAKSESIVDAKKRLQERHTALTTLSTSMGALSAPCPNDAVNGTYNRFGFKLRKKEAIDCVMKKGPMHTRKDQQQKNRDLIRGVRTNRRFELLMKARNLDA